MSSYHGWTHRPKAQGGTDPIPVVTAVAVTYAVTMFHSETAQTIPDDTLTRLVFDTDPPSGIAFANDGFLTAGNEFGAHDAGQATTEFMWTYRTGLMLVGCWVVWEAGDYPKMSALQNAGADGGAGPTGSLESLFGWADGATGVVGTDDYDAPVANMVLAQNPVETTWVTSHHHQDYWDVAADGDGASMFYVEVKQTSGVDKDVTGAKLTLMRVAETIGL